MDNLFGKGRLFLSDQNPLNIWHLALMIMEKEMIRPSFDTWIKVLSPLSYENGTFEIGTTRQIVKEWVETRYIVIIRKTLEEVLKQPIILKISLLQSDSSYISDIPIQQPIPFSNSTAMDQFKSQQRKFEENHSPLNPKYTFDSFVIGNSNRFAHAASLAVAEVPAKVYNPFFIYGGVGLGKTHLMHAIGHRIMQIHPETKVLYISSEKFTNDFINAIMSGHPENFRNR